MAQPTIWCAFAFWSFLIAFCDRIPRSSISAPRRVSGHWASLVPLSRSLCLSHSARLICSSKLHHQRGLLLLWCHGHLREPRRCSSYDVAFSEGKTDVFLFFTPVLTSFSAVMSSGRGPLWLRAWLSAKLCASPALLTLFSIGFGAQWCRPLLFWLPPAWFRALGGAWLLLFWPRWWWSSFFFETFIVMWIRQAFCDSQKGHSLHSPYFEEV